MDNINVIRNLILNMEEPFDVEDVEKVTENFDKELVVEVLVALCDAAIITHIDGLFYKEKSLFVRS